MEQETNKLELTAQIEPETVAPYSRPQSAGKPATWILQPAHWAALPADERDGLAERGCAPFEVFELGDRTVAFGTWFGSLVADGTAFEAHDANGDTVALTHDQLAIRFVVLSDRAEQWEDFASRIAEDVMPKFSTLERSDKRKWYQYLKRRRR